MTMQESDLRLCLLVNNLKIIDAETADAEPYLVSENTAQFAEAIDMVRFHDLLHRNEYQPVVAIRFCQHGENFIRVYFQQSHDTQRGVTSDHEMIYASNWSILSEVDSRRDS